MNQRHLQRGASTVHWLIALIPLLGFGAFAIDLNNVYVSHAELQAAADAGALEGARMLYCQEPSAAAGGINAAPDTCDAGVPSANQAADAAARANLSRSSAVEVLSVERGHWEFRSDTPADANGIERGGIFTANSSATPADLLDAGGNFRTFQDLNSDPNEINAVRVVTARQATPIQSFLGSLLGIDAYQATAASVAYIGFAGKILEGEVTFPLAMCLENVNDSCNVGRRAPDTGDTGGWTSYYQPDGQCSAAANSSDVSANINSCTDAGNPWDLVLGREMETNNGELADIFNYTHRCWSEALFDDGANKDIPGVLPDLDTDGDGQADRPWKWVLPVIDCTTKPGGGCNSLVGAVTVEVLWMFDSPLNDVKLDDVAPRRMTRTVGTDDAGNPVTVTWDADTAADVTDPTDGQQRWDSFVNFFNLQEPDGSPAQWADATIYYAPSCEPIDSLGGTGGANFGIRSRVPVLVF